MEHTKRQHEESAGDAAAKDVAELKEGFAQLRSDVVQLFSDVFGLGKVGADAAAHGASDAMEKLKAAVEELKESGNESVAAVSSKIKKHPWKSALIAFGAGYLLARAMGRRK